MKKVFNKKIIIPFFTAIGILAIFEWIVFPGLTAADTFINIFAGVIGFFTLVYGYYQFGLDKIYNDYFNNEPIEPEGETELDYIPKSKIKTKNVVETRKKKVTTKTK